jgi:hyperosmotically inducible periplasmic protein
MHPKFLALEVVAAAVLLPGAIAMPAIAAAPPIPDNSAADSAPNVVPGDASTPTAPAHDVDDTQVTAQIRSALKADKSLSRQAQEVAIATNQQAVTLRGSVKAGEKDRIESLAQQYAGTRQVIDQLLVKDM